MRYVAYGLPPGSDTFHQQDTVSEHQGNKSRNTIDPEAGREIPRGSDEESNTERSSVDESAKQSTSRAQRPNDDRPHGG